MRPVRRGSRAVSMERRSFLTGTVAGIAAASSTLRIVPQAKGSEIAASPPEAPASPSNHLANFLLACNGEETCRSPFSVAGPLCQMMAMGVITPRVNAKFTFDPATRRITNHEMANDLLAGVPPRKGWEQCCNL